MFDRKIYFDTIRATLFGSMDQCQVDGQEAILRAWEHLPKRYPNAVLDKRWLANMLATTYHETSAEMWPIEEYGKGQGKEYGKIDPETGQAYYGRGFVQLTWRDNYAKADRELNLTGDLSCEWHAKNALSLVVASGVMFAGMYQGWFRSDSKGPQTLGRYFNADVNDPYNAREIINGDKAYIPNWSDGVSIGHIVKSYHDKFLDALNESYSDVITAGDVMIVKVYVPKGVYVEVIEK